MGQSTFIPGPGDGGGTAGGAGPPGPSAYEVWLAAGNVGTISDYLESLRGPAGGRGESGLAGDAGAAGRDGLPGRDGTEGLPGRDGAAGRDGVDGAAGRDGQEGPPGRSAYQVWLDAGNAGTVNDYLAALKGAKGDAGADGQDGVNGLSAYELWLAAGNSGTVDDFLASLKGAQGDAGPGATPTFVAVVKQANDVATPANVAFVNTDLVFAFAAGSVYVVDLYLLATAGSSLTGFRFAWDTSVAVTTAGLAFVHKLANAGTLTGGDAIADAAARGLSSGIAANNELVPIMATGLIVTGAQAGTARLVFGPEVAAVATFKANSVMRVQKAA